jgi:hypothetical protein
MSLKFSGRGMVQKTKMSLTNYRLQADEKLSQGVKRIAFEQIDEALAHLQSSGNDLDKAVHESRKNLKKLRGLLRRYGHI